MRFFETEISGCFRIEAAPRQDARGGFARLHCPDAFFAAGIERFDPLQTNLSRNPTTFTLRGMHYQPAPFAEEKLVRVVRGAIFDVAIDLRPDSPSFKRWVGCELTAENMTALFVPEGCAHGFLTLEPDTDVLYQMGRMFEPGHGAGVRWDDPAFGIAWPAAPKLMSDRDAAYQDYTG